MHGKAQLPEDFTHFPYTDITASRTGEISYGVVGTFDGFNPFVLQGLRTTARGLFADPLFGNMVYEPLMARSYDEPFTIYNLIADEITLNDQRTSMVVHINPKARFSDGVPVKADDLVFTYKLLLSQGRIPFSYYLQQVASITKIDEFTIKYCFNLPADRELPLIIASLIPVLPRHAIDEKSFSNNDFTLIPGTGPYQIAKFDANERIIFERNERYWGATLPVNQGQNNFKKIKIEYFRNDNALFEAFKKGTIDLVIEQDPNRWHSAYNFPAAKKGLIVKDEFVTKTPPALTAFVFNTRRLIFADRQIRQALSDAFDFEWMNKNLFNNVYQRTAGFWDNSQLSSIGRPATDEELALLKPYLYELNSDVLRGTWYPLKSDGSGVDRKNIEKALSGLRKIGFKLADNRLLTPGGKPFTFEIMIRTINDEKVALAYQRSLKRLGIDVSVRTVDDSQYQNRLGTFDYDMIIVKLTNSLSPGNEQIGRWSSISRDSSGSFNYAGVHNPAIDAMIDRLLNAKEEIDYIAAVRALDRLLISGNYFIPLYHLPAQWVAHWSRINHPAQTPALGFRLTSWWSSER